MVDVDGCSSVGVDINLVRVMTARISLRRLFTIILVDLVLSMFWISCALRFSS